LGARKVERQQAQRDSGESSPYERDYLGEKEMTVGSAG